MPVTDLTGYSGGGYPANGYPDWLQNLLGGIVPGGGVNQYPRSSGQGPAMGYPAQQPQQPQGSPPWLTVGPPGNPGGWFNSQGLQDWMQRQGQQIGMQQGAPGQAMAAGINAGAFTPQGGPAQAMPGPAMQGGPQGAPAAPIDPYGATRYPAPIDPWDATNRPTPSGPTPTGAPSATPRPAPRRPASAGSGPAAQASPANPRQRFGTVQYQVPGSGMGGPLSRNPIYTTLNLFGAGQ
jgi:hypothetical protein